MQASQRSRRISELRILVTDDVLEGNAGADVPGVDVLHRLFLWNRRKPATVGV